MTRALIVMVLSLGSLLFSFRTRATRRAVRGARTEEIGHVRVIPTPVEDPTGHRGRALGALFITCIVGGVGLGLAVVVTVSTLTTGMSGLLR